jgi:GDP-L-fucose synthase
MAHRKALLMDLAGRRVLVTGGAGFLGRVVCKELYGKGVTDLIVPRRGDYDLTDENAVRHLFAHSRPEVVIHLAAEVGGIGANRVNPGRYFYANMAMGLHVIEACRRHEVEKVVQVGTVCSYPKHSPVPFREEHLWDGYPEETNAPYGIAKKSLLVMLQAYRQQYGLSGIYLVPVNLYGPGDNFDLETSHVIPALIRKFVAARDGKSSDVDLWGTGSASREFLYVDDAASGIVMAAERFDGPEPINLGTGREITVKELAKMIRGLTGYEGGIVWDPSKPDGQPRRMLDTSRAKEQFGFQAKVPLEEGLNRTISWWEASGDAEVA